MGMTRRAGEYQGSSIEYWNVSRGRFVYVDRHTGEEVLYEACEGNIVGIKLKFDSHPKFGDRQVLQIKMHGTEDDGTEKTVVLCFRLLYGKGLTMITGHGRGVLSRLCNDANNIGKDTPVRISVFPGTDNDKVTFVKVQHTEMDPFGEGLKGAEMPEDENAQIELAMKWVNELIDTYGTWEDRSESNGDDDTEAPPPATGGVDASHGAASAAVNAMKTGEKANKHGIDPEYAVQYGPQANLEDRKKNKSPFLVHNGQTLGELSESDLEKMEQYLMKNDLLPDLVKVLEMRGLPF